MTTFATITALLSIAALTASYPLDPDSSKFEHRDSVNSVIESRRSSISSLESYTESRRDSVESLDVSIEQDEVDSERPVAESEKRAALWQPKAGDSWQIVLDNPLDMSKPLSPSNVSVYDIDLFTNPTATITKLRAAPLNKKVICYFSAGSYEPDRPDSARFAKSDLGHELDGWPGEYWLNLKSPNVRNIMTARLQLARSKGCDGIDPDNVDGYENDNGLGLTKQDSINYMKFLASQSAALGLSIGLKNAGDIVGQVLPQMQFAVNEQCVQYSECNLWNPFIAAKKPVFHIEYSSSVPSLSNKVVTKMCPTSINSFSNTLKTMDLNGKTIYCNGYKATTATKS